MEPLKTRPTKFPPSNDGKAELIPYKDLVAFAAKELDAVTSVTVASHIASCPFCAAEVEHLRTDLAIKR